jgi:hypothetical protein
MITVTGMMTCEQNFLLAAAKLIICRHILVATGEWRYIKWYRKNVLVKVCFNPASTAITITLAPLSQAQVERLFCDKAVKGVMEAKLRCRIFYG